MVRRRRPGSLRQSCCSFELVKLTGGQEIQPSIHASRKRLPGGQNGSAALLPLALLKRQSRRQQLATGWVDHSPFAGIDVALHIARAT